MEMRAMMDLKEMLCKELDEITKKGELNAGGLDAVHKLTDTIKNIDKIMMLEDDDDGYSQRGGYGRGGDRGYSRAGEWEARGHFGRHGYDDHGSSYARRRDSRGRYSRDEGRHEMMETLEEMMSTAQGKDREIISRAMDELRRA